MSTQLQTTVMPGRPEPVKDIVYVLYYRVSSRPVPDVKHFVMRTTDMRAVMERTQSYCKRMNLRFVRVEPFMSDLDADERKQTGSLGEEVDD